MAWTTPKTWSAGETLTAANFNAQIRDNLLMMGPNLVLRKTADMVTSSTTFADAVDLSWSVGANETWAFSGSLYIGASGSGGCKIALSIPASSPGEWDVAFGASSGSYAWSQSAIAGGADTGTLNFVTNSSLNAVKTAGIIVVGATPGTIQLRFASFTGSSVTLFANSFLEPHRKV